MLQPLDGEVVHLRRLETPALRAAKGGRQRPARESGPTTTVTLISRFLGRGPRAARRTDARSMLWRSTRCPHTHASSVDKGCITALRASRSLWRCFKGAVCPRAARAPTQLLQVGAGNSPPAQKGSASFESEPLTPLAENCPAAPGAVQLIYRALPCVGHPGPGGLPASEMTPSTRKAKPPCAPRVVEGLSRRHLEALARELRPSDRAEVAAWGLEPLHALELSASASTEVYTVLSGDRVVMAFGVGPKPLDGEPAYGIWMLSTPLLEDFPRWVAREARAWIDQFRGRYGTLWNIAHAGNELHVRWIDWQASIATSMASRTSARSPQAPPADLAAAPDHHPIDRWPAARNRSGLNARDRHDTPTDAAPVGP
jgi:hypothetical protein